MIVRTPGEFIECLSNFPLKLDQPCTPKAAFMVEPSGFRVSEQTARDNAYMATQACVDPHLARDQHRALAECMAQRGLPVIRFVGHSKTPDDLFCNNVFATHPGHLIVGAMKHPERRLEAERQDIRVFFQSLLGYKVTDLSQLSCVAELTGCLIIDRARGIGFCGMSPRVDSRGLEAMHDAFRLNMTYCFELKPYEYHTNVVMSILASRCLVICPDAFEDPKVPVSIMSAFNDHVIEISSDEKQAFAGNCLAINAQDVMISQTALDQLRPATQEAFTREGFVLRPIAMTEIEKAGGSVRCCIGEIY